MNLHDVIFQRLNEISPNELKEIPIHKFFLQRIAKEMMHNKKFMSGSHVLVSNSLDLSLIPKETPIRNIFIK